jgi:hypothetical protein
LIGGYSLKMPTGPNEPQPEASPKPLSERIERFRVEIQKLVAMGTEHPRFELTQQASISRENSKARADFVKLIQGLANAHLQEERVLVIGADQKSRAFVPVTNGVEFDPNNVQSVLGKFLYPTPLHEVFALNTDDGSPFIIVVLAARQPRPVVAKADAKDHDGRHILKKGEVWFKQGTGLHLAASDDFEAVIQERVESEAEARARSRFAHFRDEIIVTQQLHQFAGRRIPTSELIYGKDEEFQLYAKELILAEDTPRFNMLVETLRDVLIDDWNKLDGFSRSPLEYNAEYKKLALRHKNDIFIPAMSRTVELGMLIIKHDASQPWFASVADTLVDVFESACSLVGLAGLEEAPVLEEHFERYSGQNLPAIEAWIGARALAAYSMKRRQFRFTSSLIKKFVRMNRLSEVTLVPLLFWAMYSRVQMKDSYISFCWSKRVERLWRAYFRNKEEFFQASCELEFVLELNSYVGMGYAGKKSEPYLQKHAANSSFYYRADIWQYRLGALIPLAELYAEALRRGIGDIVIQSLSVLPAMFQTEFGGATEEARLDFLGGFLDYLRNTQVQIFHGEFRMPFEHSWGLKLSAIVQGFKNRKADDQKQGAS